MIQGKLFTPSRKLVWSSFGSSVAFHLLGLLLISLTLAANPPSTEPESLKPRARARFVPPKQTIPPPPPQAHRLVIAAIRPVVPVSEYLAVPVEMDVDTTVSDTSGFSVDDLALPLPEGGQMVVEQVVQLEEDEPVELWKVETPPKEVKKVVPVYPDIARKAGIEGKVFVTVLVGRDGKVEKLGEVTGLEVFRESAKAAALQWEFTPAIQNDKPVRVWVSLPFTFQFRKE